MSTFLQLTQRLARECGISGTGPLSTQGQVGEASRLVNWVASAWLEIQGLHDTWGFLREQFSFQATQGVGDYTPTAAGINDFRYWFCDTLRCYRTEIGYQDEQWLVEWEYQVFRNTYRFNLQRELQGRPMVFAVQPNTKALMFGPLPDDTYTVVGEYQARPTPLVNDSDVPDLGTSSALELIIVYKAMQSYGLYEAAPEVIQRGQAEYQKLLNQLEREQLHSVYMGDPLA